MTCIVFMEVHAMEFMSTKELQEELGISRTTAYSLVQSGEVPSIKIGRSYRIPREMFEAWVKDKARTKTKNK